MALKVLALGAKPCKPKSFFIANANKKEKGKMVKATIMEAIGIICIVLSGSFATYLAGVKGLAVVLIGIGGTVLLVLGLLQEVK